MTVAGWYKGELYCKPKSKMACSEEEDEEEEEEDD